MALMSVAPIYEPNLTEKSRQDFVLSLKRLANGAAQQRVRDAYRRDLLPRIRAKLEREPASRKDIEGELACSAEFRYWAVLTHHSQSMMWAAIEPTAQRVEPVVSSRLAALRGAELKGSLELDPNLLVPAPISNTEIHRQPIGYCGVEAGDDVLPGLRYLGAAMIYSVGKGNTHAATDGRGKLLLDEIARRRPGWRPRRILDLGCGIGVHAQPIALAFPEAEYHAVDVAAGLLRYGHVAAEARGVPIHFHQRDAADTRFDEASFDLVISNILFHETSHEWLPRILRECRRVLAPGGLMVHADVATQTSRLGLDDQVMNAWQDHWNGEPFWSGFAESDLRAAMIAAGFPAETVFAEHVKGGSGFAYVFGAA
jgi:SAM-dependent methyltransferase